MKDTYPADDVLYKDGSDDEDPSVETEGQTDFEIATNTTSRSVSVNATVKTEDKGTQYEVFIPNFTLGFDEENVDVAIVDAITQTVEFGNDEQNPIIIN